MADVTATPISSAKASYLNCVSPQIGEMHAYHHPEGGEKGIWEQPFWRQLYSFIHLNDHEALR